MTQRLGWLDDPRLARAALLSGGPTNPPKVASAQCATGWTSGWVPRRLRPNDRNLRLFPAVADRNHMENLYASELTTVGAVCVVRFQPWAEWEQRFADAGAVGSHNSSDFPGTSERPKGTFGVGIFTGY